MNFHKYYFNVPFLAMTVVTAASCFFFAVSIMAVKSHEKIKRFDKIECIISEGQEPKIEPHISGMGYIGSIEGTFANKKGEIYNVTIYSHPPPYIVNQKSAKKVTSIMNSLQKKGRVEVRINNSLQKAYSQNVNIRSWGSALFVSIVILFVSVVFWCIFFFDQHVNSSRKDCCHPTVVNLFTCGMRMKVEPEIQLN